MKINFLGSTPFISPSNFDNCIDPKKNKNIKPKQNSVLQKINVESKIRPVSTQVAALNFIGDETLLTHSTITSFGPKTVTSKPFVLPMPEMERKEQIKTALNNTKDIFEVTLASNYEGDKSLETTFKINSKGMIVKITKDRAENKIVKMESYSSEIDKTDDGIKEFVLDELDKCDSDDLLYFIIAHVE